MKECCRQYLMEQFGDESVVEEIYNEYVSSLGQKIAECDKALDARDWDTLDKAAHAMKGNSLAAGDEATANEAIELRHAAKLQDWDTASALVARIREFSSQL